MKSGFSTEVKIFYGYFKTKYRFQINFRIDFVYIFDVFYML